MTTGVRVGITPLTLTLTLIDMVCLDYKNSEILFKETLEGKQMGYTGKQVT